MISVNKIDNIIEKFNTHEPEKSYYQSEGEKYIYREYNMLEEHVKEYETTIEEKRVQMLCRDLQ